MLAVLFTLGARCDTNCWRARDGTPIEAALRTTSATNCPAHSHGLYRLRGHINASATACALADTFACVHPPWRDTIISRGLVYKGRWMIMCNEDYRIRTICSIIAGVRATAAATGASVWVLDAGANLGTFTLPLVAAGVNVLAFEADPANVALLRGSLAAQKALHEQGPTTSTTSTPLGRAILVPGALGSVSGHTVCVQRGEQNNSGSSMVRAPVPAAGGGAQPGGAGASERSQPCAPRRLLRTHTLDGELDRLMSDGQLDVQGAEGAKRRRVVFAALKMDVQGYEAEVLGGAPTMLRERPPKAIFIETRNRSLLSKLIHAHGYHRKGNPAGRDGCEYNARLELG